jgi:hypothetical protein
MGIKLLMSMVELGLFSVSLLKEGKVTPLSCRVYTWCKMIIYMGIILPVQGLALILISGIQKELEIGEIQLSVTEGIELS